MTEKCKWCPQKNCGLEQMATCRRKKQLDFYEKFFKEDWKDMDEAIVDIDKKKEAGAWWTPDWK